jgi:hypothetical protein
MEGVQIEVTMGLDSGLCLQGHSKWVGDFSTFVGVYKDDNMLHMLLSLLPNLLLINCSAYLIVGWVGV